MFAPQHEPQRPQRPIEGFIPNPKLRLQDQCREVMRFKHYSFRTEQTYWEWIKRFILFHGNRHPRDMAEAEVTAFSDPSGGGARCSGVHSKPGIERRAFPL